MHDNQQYISFDTELSQTANLGMQNHLLERVVLLPVINCMPENKKKESNFSIRHNKYRLIYKISTI